MELVSSWIWDEVDDSKSYFDSGRNSLRLSHKILKATSGWRDQMRGRHAGAAPIIPAAQLSMSRTSPKKKTGQWFVEVGSMQKHFRANAGFGLTDCEVVADYSMDLR